MTVERIKTLIMFDSATDFESKREILAEFDRLTALNAQLLEACKAAQHELQSTQENWREQNLFDANDILQAAIRAAEETVKQ